jgi:predicted outer membrane repeat protein
LGEGEKPKIVRHDASQGYRLVNMQRPLKITFAEMRSAGDSGSAIHCSDFSLALDCD